MLRCKEHEKPIRLAKQEFISGSIRFAAQSLNNNHGTSLVPLAVPKSPLLPPHPQPPELPAASSAIQCRLLLEMRLPLTNPYCLTWEGAAVNKDLSAGMPKDLRSKARNLPSPAARGHCQLSKAGVVDSEEVE